MIVRLPGITMPCISISEAPTRFATGRRQEFFYLVVLYLTITIDETSGQSSESTMTTTTESSAPTMASLNNNPPKDDNIWVILGPVLGGLGIVLLCAMGCWMQHKEFMFELQTRRRP